MTFTGFVSANEIMADVYGAVGDPKGARFSDGFMISQIQQALAEMGMTTLFEERLWTHEIDGHTELDLPSGVVNIDKLFVFFGNECTASSSQPVWWMKDWFRTGAAQFKEQKGADNNNFIMEDVMYNTTAGQVLGYNTLNGKLMLTNACLAYEKVMMKYRGLGCDFGSAPAIPHVLRQAVKDWVILECLKHKQWDAVDARVTQAMREAKESYYGNGSITRPGSWLAARRVVMSMDIKAQNDLSKYLSGLSGSMMLDQ